jgi:hypothetical protein
MARRVKEKIKDSQEANLEIQLNRENKEGIHTNVHSNVFNAVPW